MAIWHEVLARLDHRDVWGPGGLFPLEAFRPAGSRYVARCPNPVHPDRHPSFSMPKGKPFGSCFACGYRIGWIAFTMERQGARPDARGEPFWAALRTLAERAGMTLPDRRTRERPAGPPTDPLAAACAAAAQYLRQALRGGSAEAQRVRDYLVARGLALTHVPLFPLGVLDSARALVRVLTAAGCGPKAIRETGLVEPYMTRHCLIFLYTDGREVTGFKGRVPERALKEVRNAKGFGGAREARSLFGLELADEAIAASGRAILVEGEFDCLAIQSALLSAKGTSAELVALGGTAKPTREKFRVLHQLGAHVLYLAFDGDPAGHRAMAQALPMAWAESLDALVLPMPEGATDPDEALQTMGLERCLQEVFSLGRAIPGGRWLARHLVLEAQASPEGEVALRRRAIELGLLVPAGEIRTFLAPLSEALGTSAASLEKDLQAAAREARERGARERLAEWAKRFQVAILGTPSLAGALQEAESVLRAVRVDLDERPERRNPDA